MSGNVCIQLGDYYLGVDREPGRSDRWRWRVWVADGMATGGFHKDRRGAYEAALKLVPEKIVVEHWATLPYVQEREKKIS